MEPGQPIANGFIQGRVGVWRRGSGFVYLSCFSYQALEGSVGIINQMTAAEFGLVQQLDIVLDGHRRGAAGLGEQKRPHFPV